ncbi:hypothetical protein [Rubidibacter lacunae]|nr:hypothetical protein [Rubidibacter lacunae]
MPIVLLILAFGSTLWYQRTANDIYRALAVSLTLPGLIWGFAIAHWSIHLFGLLLLLRFTRPTYCSACSGD